MKKTFLLFALMTLCGAGFAQNSSEKLAAATENPALKEYEGVFKFKEYFQKAKFEYKEGSLYVEVDQNGQFKMLVLEADKFKSTSSYGSIFTFKRDENKKIVSVKMEIMGNELVADKE